jgi:DNA-binding transcriptional LysR family regulator
MIDSFSKKNPDINVSIEEMETDRLMLMLRYSDCNLVFVGDIHLDPNEYGIQSFQREQFMIAVSPDHPFAHRDTVAMKDLKDVPLILNRPESLLYYPCVDACKAAGFTPTIVTTTTRPNIAFEYLYSNKDYAYMGLKHTLLGEASEKHRAIPISDSPEFEFVFAWRKKTGLTKSAAALLDFIKPPLSRDPNCIG